MSLCAIYVRTSIEKEDTSIEQQKNLGVSFAKKNNFEYQIYEDIGKSGYKIDDDNNPFENRPAFKKLLHDIETKIIDKVWVFEHSRLSRHEVSNRVIQKIFSKHNVILFENEKQFDLNNPQNIFFNQLLTSFSQYERSLIIDRTKRGVHDTINRGIRSFNSLYGYKNSGKNENGYALWKPVEFEIENIKYAYKKFLGGSSIKSITEDIYKNKPAEKARKAVTTIISKWSRILCHFEYTGFSLTTDGLAILKQYKNFKIDSLSEITDKVHFVKCLSFPVIIVSVENWITVMEKLHDTKKVYKDKIRYTDTQMATGIISCPYCSTKWYFLIKNSTQSSYQHFSNSSCHQRPKSMKIEILDNLFSLFYFYYNLVFDDTKNLIKENQEIMKINLLEIREKIKVVEIDNRKIDKQLGNIQSICEETTDKDLLKLSLIKENNLNLKKEKNADILNKLKFELDELNKKYSQDELTLTYYSVEKNVVDFFEKMTVDEKRASLIRIIKNCQLFNNYLVIDATNILFVFNIKDKLALPQDIYNEFKNDKYFKTNFLETKLLNADGTLKSDIKKFVNTPAKEAVDKYSADQLLEIEGKLLLHHYIRRLGDLEIKEHYLNKKTLNAFKRKLEILEIDYDISDTEKIISFTTVI